MKQHLAAGYLCALLSLWLPFGAAGASAQGGLAWFVQVSDIHLSRFAREQMPQFGDKEGDFGHFASEILRPLAPGALVLTGDLVDGKTRLMRGAQDEGEWKRYRRLIENATAAGVPEDAILDLRGNHDVFDVIERGVPPDFFASYAAAGRRNATQRVSMLPLPDHSAAGSSDSSCPAAVVLGIDLTPSPGLRGPTDFFGRADAALLAEVDAALTKLHAQTQLSGCAPVVVGAGHYPLSVVVHPDTARYDRLPAPGGARNHLPTSSKRLAEDVNDGSLRGLLASHGVAAYVCGHLHGLFSQRQHLLHPALASGHLAELESTAWKDDRRFRILVADAGALSFADLYLNSPTKVKPRPPPAEPTADSPQQRRKRGPTDTGYSIVSIEPTQRINGHIVVITSPPDARYAPLAAGGPRTFDAVRALVFPINSVTAEKVVLRWRCKDKDAWQQAPMERAAEGQPLFSASIGDQLRCEPWDGTDPYALLQVVVSESDGRTSTSEERQVALSDEAARQPTSSGSSGKKKLVGSRHQASSTAAGESAVPKQRLAEPAVPLPLGNAAMGRFVLWCDMGRFGTRCGYALWAAHLLGMLLLPRLLPARLTDTLRRRSGGMQGSSSGVNIGGGSGVNGNNFDGGEAAGLAFAVLQTVAAPLLALQDMSTMGIPWLLQVCYAAYLARGPWFAARFLSSAPLGLYFPAGVLLKHAARAGDPLPGGWRFTRMPDTLILCFHHWLFTLLPGTLWLAWVLSGWRRRGRRQPGGSWRRPATRGGTPAPFTIMQVLTGLPLTYAHLLNVRRLWRLFGPSSVFASPGFGWTLPLTAALLAGAWFGDSAAPPQSTTGQDAAANGPRDGDAAVHVNGEAASKDKHS